MSIWALWRRQKFLALTWNRTELQFLGRPTTSLVTIPIGIFSLQLFLWASPYAILMPVVSSLGASLILRPVGLQSDTTLRHLSSPLLFICFIERMIQKLLLVLNSVYCGSKILVSITHVYTDTEWHKKRGTFEKPNKNWINPRKKIYWQKFNHYNLPFKRK